MAVPRINEDCDEVEYDGDLILYSGEPFTGIGYEETQSGVLISEIAYKKGLPHGPGKLWYRSGQPKAVTNNHRGLSHGVSTFWYENGELKEENSAEFGITLWKKCWDERGTMVEDYTIEKGSGQWRLLEKHRVQYADW